METLVRHRQTHDCKENTAADLAFKRDEENLAPQKKSTTTTTILLFMNQETGF